MNNNNETPCGLPQPTSVRLIEPVKLSTNWQQVRIQAAIAAMNIVKGAYNIHNDVERLVHHSVRVADALIAELRKGGEE